MPISISATPYAARERREAIAEYREAIRLEPGRGISQHLGTTPYELSRDDPEVEAEFREAIRLKPVSARYHTNLGNALRGRGNSTRPLPIPRCDPPPARVC